jgi:hypothetical protein
MWRRKTLITSGCFASLLLAAGCATTTPQLAGKIESAPKDEAEIILYLKGDGTLIRAEGLMGGNFEKEFALPGNPGGLGRKIADIEIWEHDGSIQDLTVGNSPTGASAHPHSGPVNPPFNTHCHKYITVGGQPVMIHCP